MSAGSSPAFPNIQYPPQLQLINNLNIALSRKRLKGNAFFSKKNLRLVKILYHFGVIKSYVIVKADKPNYYKIKFSIFFYKHATFFNHVGFISTSSKKFYVSLAALKKLILFSSSSIYILNTSYGLISHFQAIRYKIGGVIACIIS